QDDEDKFDEESSKETSENVSTKSSNNEKVSQSQKKKDDEGDEEKNEITGSTPTNDDPDKLTSPDSGAIHVSNTKLPKEGDLIKLIKSNNVPQRGDQKMKKNEDTYDTEINKPIKRRQNYGRRSEPNQKKQPKNPNPKYVLVSSSDDEEFRPSVHRGKKRQTGKRTKRQTGNSNSDSDRNKKSKHDESDQSELSVRPSEESDFDDAKSNASDNSKNDASDNSNDDLCDEDLTDATNKKNSSEVILNNIIENNNQLSVRLSKESDVNDVNASDNSKNENNDDPFDENSTDATNKKNSSVIIINESIENNDELSVRRSKVSDVNASDNSKNENNDDPFDENLTDATNKKNSSVVTINESIENNDELSVHPSKESDVNDAKSNEKNVNKRKMDDLSVNELKRIKVHQGDSDNNKRKDHSSLSDVDTSARPSGKTLAKKVPKKTAKKRGATNDVVDGDGRQPKKRKKQKDSQQASDATKERGNNETLPNNDDVDAGSSVQKAPVSRRLLRSKKEF
ncbi:protein starmaker-like, partial [Contarinia nasturtii]|uniref:protein starmaker-like n=1 Tax=Contarinia nasturtii TaxID=265458 RepID=UPI0012D3CF84